MRHCSLLLVLAATGCAVRVPRPGQLGIGVKTTTRVRVEARVQVPATAQVIVPIQNAPVVEFFGVPLEGAQDVVFVLDCSGSMSEVARGRLAEIQEPPPPPTAGPSAESTSTAPGGVSVGPAAPPPPDSNAPPPPDPNAPPPDPNAQPVAPPPAVTSHSKLQVAQFELVDAINKLPEGTRMNVIFFNSELEAFAPEMFTLDANSRATLTAFINGTEPNGSTALAPAMRTAFIMNARRVVLLSDGLGNVGGGFDAVVKDAREAMHGGVRIDTVGVGSGQDGALLSTLANESGGLYQPL